MMPGNAICVTATVVLQLSIELRNLPAKSLDTGFVLSDKLDGRRLIIHSSITDDDASSSSFRAPARRTCVRVCVCVTFRR